MRTKMAALTHKNVFYIQRVWYQLKKVPKRFQLCRDRHEGLRDVCVRVGGRGGGYTSVLSQYGDALMQIA